MVDRIRKVEVWELMKTGYWIKRKPRVQAKNSELIHCLPSSRCSATSRQARFMCNGLLGRQMPSLLFLYPSFNWWAWCQIVWIYTAVQLLCANSRALILTCDWRQVYKCLLLIPAGVFPPRYPSKYSGKHNVIFAYPLTGIKLFISKESVYVFFLPLQSFCICVSDVGLEIQSHFCCKLWLVKMVLKKRKGYPSVPTHPLTDK